MHWDINIDNLSTSLSVTSFRALCTCHPEWSRRMVLLW